MQKHCTNAKLKHYFNEPNSLYNNSQDLVQGIVNVDAATCYHNSGG